MKRVILTITLLALVLLLSSCGRPLGHWTMIDVNQRSQGDAHLLNLQNYRALIDAGDDAPALISFFQRHDLHALDAVFISHAHKDHYAALIPLIDSGVRVEAAYLNVPPQELCNREANWGCDYSDFIQFIEALEDRNVPTRSAAPSIVFSRGNQKLEILFAFEDVRDINDTSLIMSLEVEGRRALFTGDLNETLGMYLAVHQADTLRADVLKVPHHGVEGAAPNAFFAAVGARVVLVPAPASLWLENPRARRVRNYLKDKEVWVNGLHGDVSVTFSRAGIEVVGTRP